LRETDEPRPTDAYGRSKLAAEHAVAAVFPGEWTCLRPALVLGRGAKGNLAQLRRLAASPLPPPFGALDNRRSVVGLGNLCDAVAFALEAPGLARRTALVAEFEPLSVRDLMAAMRAAAGRSRWLMPVPKSLLSGGLRAIGRSALAQSLTGSLEVDAAVLRSLGWRPGTPLAAEIAALMDPFSRRSSGG
jgi:UDP-glucose 4-epimerase